MRYYLKKNIWSCAGVGLLSIFTWGMQTVTALMLIQCFKMALNLDFRGFLIWMGLDLATWAIYFCFGMIEGYFEAKTIRKLNDQVRHDLMLSLLSKDYASYHKGDTGEYLSYLTNNVKEIEKRAWNPFFNAIGRVAQIIWSLIALASLHWALLLSAILFAFMMWLFPKLFHKKMENLGDEYATAQAKGTVELKELLSGLDILRFFNHRDRFIEKGDKAGDYIEKHGFRISYIENNIGGIIGFINVAVQLATDIIIVFLAVNGLIDLAVIGGGGSLTGGVSNGFDNLAKCRLSIAGVGPFFSAITTHEEQEKSKVKTESLPIFTDKIVVDKVSYSYNGHTVLSDLDLVFEKGKKYAIIGASGSGKSTLLKVIMGWLNDYSGSILYDGLDLRNFTPEQIQAQMSYIEQDVFLFNSSISENITLGKKCEKDQLKKVLKDSALVHDIDVLPLGIDTIVGENGNNLSGGQKQRVAIARALFHNRSILLVDEGTSALDKDNADIVEKSLLANTELTLILVSHHLSDERKQQFDKIVELI